MPHGTDEAEDRQPNSMTPPTTAGGEHDRRAREWQDVRYMAEGQLHTRRILVTGAAGGQGMAVARRFAAEGASLALSDLPGPRLESLAAEIHASGSLSPPSPGTCATRSKLQRSCGRRPKCLEGWTSSTTTRVWTGRAGTRPSIASIGTLYDEVMAINTTSVFLFTKHAIPYLLESREGALLNVASVAAYAGDTECHAYAASKGALIGLTRSIAQHYGPLGLRAVVICPGFIATPMVDWLLEDSAATEAWSTRRRFGGSASRMKSPRSRPSSPQRLRRSSRRPRSSSTAASLSPLFVSASRVSAAS